MEDYSSYTPVDLIDNLSWLTNKEFAQLFLHCMTIRSYLIYRVGGWELGQEVVLFIVVPIRKQQRIKNRDDSTCKIVFKFAYGTTNSWKLVVDS